MYNDSFNYDAKNNIINILYRQLEKSTNELINSFVDTIMSLNYTISNKSSLNVGVVKRKINRIILDLPLHNNDNLDIIEYSDSSDIYLNSKFYDMYEKYIRMNVYELTGVSYSEFKSMTSVEYDLFYKYLALKLNILDLETPELIADDSNNNNEFLYN